MSRRRLSLAEPPEDLRKLDGFPRKALGTRTALFRVVRKDREPWWFSSSGAGRFDLAEPRGTCYLSLDPFAALLEVIGPDRSEGMITAEMLAARRLRELRLPAEHSMADLTDRRTAGFGLTLEISSSHGYGRTQAWARALAGATFEGLLYHARHDPAAGKSVAVFGDSGKRPEWDPGPARKLDGPEWVRRLWDVCRIRVATRPYKRQITVTD